VVGDMEKPGGTLTGRLSPLARVEKIRGLGRFWERFPHIDITEKKRFKENRGETGGICGIAGKRGGSMGIR